MLFSNRKYELLCIQEMTSYKHKHTHLCRKYAPSKSFPSSQYFLAISQLGSVSTLHMTKLYFTLDISLQY